MFCDDDVGSESESGYEGGGVRDELFFEFLLQGTFGGDGDIEGSRLR